MVRVIGLWGLEDVRQEVRAARVCGFSLCFGRFETRGFEACRLATGRDV